MKKALSVLLAGSLLFATDALALSERLVGNLSLHTVNQYCNLVGRQAFTIARFRHIHNVPISELRESLSERFFDNNIGMINYIYSYRPNPLNAEIYAEQAELVAKIDCLEYHLPHVR
ncbi:hypothetical protein V6U78_07285 [Marinospirillum sp. MEB164]|uniref:Uncharacterized protein n=1 Tax=Marinospirillum alkalitolerans TaxID=3123374 RepID=A0ABW8PX50_9GAMM